MASHIQDNFKLEMTLPDVERQLFDSIADMVLFSQEEMKLPEVYECNVRDTGKRYRYNVNNTVDPTLGKWRLVEGGTAEEVYFTTTSPVTNKVGEFDLAEEITETDKITLNEAINRILHLNVDPEATLEVTKMTSLMEIGQSVQNPQLRLVFTSLGNATITNIQFLKNDVEINNQTFVAGTTEYKYDDINTVSSNVVYKAVITYNFGKGDKTLIKTFRADFVRKTFYGTTDQDTFDLTSDNIRALSGGVLGVAKGDKFNINIPTGSKEVIIAYPSVLGDITDIIFVEGMNASIKDAFTLQVVSLEDYGGTVSNYNVYTYKPVNAYSKNYTYTVTI